VTREAAAVPIRLPSRSFVEGRISVVIWRVLSVSNKFWWVASIANTGIYRLGWCGGGDVNAYVVPKNDHAPNLREVLQTPLVTPSPASRRP
jgi:hypothetical protein